MILAGHARRSREGLGVLENAQLRPVGRPPSTFAGFLREPTACLVLKAAEPNGIVGHFGNAAVPAAQAVHA
eukprot:11272442-Alexandrium_andersonii.AAC.1